MVKSLSQIHVTIWFYIILFLSLVSCGPLYYFENGGPRPKINRFDTTKLSETDYKMIDTNAVYVSTDKTWFYKFHLNNKVGLFNLKTTNIDKIQEFTSKNGKMGYYQLNGEILTTYIYVKNDFATFNKSKLIISKDTIVNTRNKEYFVRLKTDWDLMNLRPDW